MSDASQQPASAPDDDARGVTYPAYLPLGLPLGSPASVADLDVGDGQRRAGFEGWFLFAPELTRRDRRSLAKHAHPTGAAEPVPLGLKIAAGAVTGALVAFVAGMEVWSYLTADPKVDSLASWIRSATAILAVAAAPILGMQWWSIRRARRIRDRCITPRQMEQTIEDWAPALEMWRRLDQAANQLRELDTNSKQWLPWIDPTAVTGLEWHIGSRICQAARTNALLAAAEDRQSLASLVAARQADARGEVAAITTALDQLEELAAAAAAVADRLREPEVAQALLADERRGIESALGAGGTGSGVSLEELTARAAVVRELLSDLEADPS